MIFQKKKDNIYKSTLVVSATSWLLGKRKIQLVEVQPREKEKKKKRNCSFFFVFCFSFLEKKMLERQFNPNRSLSNQRLRYDGSRGPNSQATRKLIKEPKFPNAVLRETALESIPHCAPKTGGQECCIYCMYVRRRL